MSTYYHFVDVFETTILDGSPQQIIVQPVKIELLPALPRELVVPTYGPPVVAAGEDATLAHSSTLRLEPPAKHIVLTTRTAEPQIPVARRWCEAQLDSAVASLSLILGPTSFAKRLYRGWIDDGKTAIVEVPFRAGQMTHLPKQNLEQDLRRIAYHVARDADLHRRFVLMSRFFSKAVVAPFSEERFLYLWTMLEIFPMRDTTDIKPISIHLGQLTSRDPQKLKSELAIGKLCGARSRLVHDGDLGWNDQELAHELSKLERMCGEVLASLAGRPYGGSLDQYLDGSS